jgi:hypothetical protein
MWSHISFGTTVLYIVNLRPGPHAIISHSGYSPVERHIFQGGLEPARIVTILLAVIFTSARLPSLLS